MRTGYGYFTVPGTAAPQSKDGDPVDVFLGPDLESDVVVVIDQYLGGKFDEHKVVIGAKSEEEARKLYLSNYSKGWKCGPTTKMSVDEFKAWLKSGDCKKPVSL